MEFVLPSSPVWYQTTASDTSKDGYFAFASRSLIYLFDIRQDIPVYYGILSGHEERVTACSFSSIKPSSHYLLLVSGDDDGVVKAWNVLIKTITKEIKIPGMGKISSLHWSPLSEDLVIVGDDKGCLVVWNYDKGSTNKFFPDGAHQQITCIKCSPHYKQLVAVGYKSGAVSIIDIFNRGMVIRKFRGHGNEIHSLAWSSSPSEEILLSLKSDLKQDVEGKIPFSVQYESVLVSGSKDRTIRIWSLSRGKAVKIIKLKAKSSKVKRACDDNARLYVALFWPETSESSFISSSYNGDLFLWDLSRQDKEMQQQVFSSQSPDSSHQRIIFNINSGFNSKSSLITTSMDRQIKIWSLSNPCLPPLCSLPTLGGYVYSIAISPIDPSLLALGVGDGAIRVWKTHNPRNTFDVTVLWQGVKEKVMSLAWCPTKEGILAFGTEDGKVGLYDVLAMKPPTLSETYHLKPVYALSWGPRCFPEGDDVQDELICLYTCGGEGVILMHPQELAGHGIDVMEVITATNPSHPRSRRSEVSWKKNSKLVAMGNDNGTFDIYRAPHLHHLISVKVHNKIINCLRWKPDPSEIHCWIASGSNNNNVCVTNIDQFIKVKTDDAHAEETNVHVVNEPFRSLNGHTARITGLAWNQNNPTELASSSYDGTVQVWDVKESVGLANYRGHDGRVLCVGWSPIPHDDSSSGLLYSGGDDYSVHVWRAEKQEHKIPPKELQHGFTQKQSQWKKKAKKKRPMDHAQTHPDTNSPIGDNNVNEVDIDALLENKRKELLADMHYGSDGDSSPEGQAALGLTSDNTESSNLNPNAEPFLAPQENFKDAILDLSETRSVATESKDDADCGRSTRRKRVKNLFPLSVFQDNQKKETLQLDCIDIVRYKQERLKNQSVDTGNVGLYGDRKSTYRMLGKEDRKLVEMESFEGSSILKVWSADIVGAVECAIERNDLTDQLVALATMGGYDLWLRACTSFAYQLSKDGMHLHAANYLVACNKVPEAIVLLRDNKFYREAVAMARIRLHDNDPLLIETVTVWAHRLSNGGSYEMAAKCFSSIGEYQRAADCLSEKARSKTIFCEDDLRSLFAAAVLAKIAGLKNWHDYVKLALVNIATCSGKWLDGHLAANVYDSHLRFVRLILCVHELLYLFYSVEIKQKNFLSDQFPDHVHSNWTNLPSISDKFDFKTTLDSVWIKILRDIPIEFEEIKSSLNEINIGDIESLCVNSSYDGLTLNQSLLKTSLHLSCLFLLYHSTEKKVFRSVSDHMTTFQCISEEMIRNILVVICASFDLEFSKTTDDDILTSNVKIEKCYGDATTCSMSSKSELTLVNIDLQNGVV